MRREFKARLEIKIELHHLCYLKDYTARIGPILLSWILEVLTSTVVELALNCIY